ncbi:acetate/propionate family kinase [Ruminococcus sp.]|uniref:acetate/propionate family kinase n=1 Tax=Ruminococcus sp. TaxID=41978 RepID=UPI002619FFA9|nr:acetate kinase [Ruminococcus sp.]MDD6988719.1 acetate kinase [Ruminococcus sp.]MDY6201469.1 acetate kinase [Ruminococcus sp.]
MKILVINAGSSSLKYQLIDMADEKVLAKGNCERIGTDGAFIGFKAPDGKKIERKTQMLNHTQAFEAVKNALIDPEYGAIKNLSEVTAIGHRVVQGGSYFDKSVLVNNDVINKIKELAPLAPLHNPAHIQGIEACTRVFGAKVPQVAVFDTAFHQTMPEKAFMYAIPYKYYEKFGVRKYGFHGTSHRYVTDKMADLMGRKKEELKLITCHIGNGSSITAVKNGKVIDTTMGLTPLGGFMMGTRSGSLDPSVVTFIAEKEHLTPDEISKILNKESGLLGVSGISSDDRDVSAAEADGNLRAHLAHEMLYYQIAQYIGSYYVALGGCDGIVFTAGLGENQPQLREKVCDYLACLGVKLDKEFNAKAMRGVTGTLSTPDSKIRVELIATDEEMVIARDTKAIVETL